MALYSESPLLLLLSCIVSGLFLVLSRRWATPVKAVEFRVSDNDSYDARSIAVALRDKDAIVFYGSQTGTAEDYARRLAKSMQNDYGIEAMVADLEDYDMDSLNAVVGLKTSRNQPKLVAFVLATYGDGEPTDNATELHSFIAADEPSFAFKNNTVAYSDAPLTGLHYIAFGLGNSTYEKYNQMVRFVDGHLRRLGAVRLGDCGEGDDGQGTMDEDFMSWKEKTLVTLSETMNLQRIEHIYRPSITIVERKDMATTDNEVYLGERNSAQLCNHGVSVPGFTNKNPYLAPIAYSRQLYAPTCQRQCLHVEFDISNTSLSYHTGDHVGVWPCNPDSEIRRFLNIIGLQGKENTVIDISPISSSGVGPVLPPQPTTYATVLRHHLEICGRVSREVISILATMSPTPEAKEIMVRLGSDREYFQSFATARYLSLGQLMEIVSQGEPWLKVPFSFAFEAFPPLQPRFYSISSSHQLAPTRVHITAAIKSETLEDSMHGFKGLATNYLMALANAKPDDSSSDGYEVRLPRAEWNGLRSGIFIRHSTFRLPPAPETPIIMVGPGTGIAPFRAFLQDRALLKSNAVPVGMNMLFTGCRKRDEDFMYAEEWEILKKELGNAFKLFTAFSRDTPQKVYVQDRLRENKVEILKLLNEQQAWFYICGDAGGMAKGVHAVLEQLASGADGAATSHSTGFVAALKAQGRFHEDVW